MLEKDDRLGPVAEELAQKLTNLLSYNHLSAGDGLMLLARLSATYVHVLQGDIEDTKVRDGIEDGELLKMLADGGKPDVADAACRKLIKDLKNFSRDPAALRAAREALISKGR